MKTYPQAVLDMFDSGRLNYAYLMSIKFDTPVYFTSAGFDVDYDGKTFVNSSEMTGVGELSKTSSDVVTELQVNLSLKDSAAANAIYSADVYGLEVDVERAFLDESNDILHVERVWEGKVSSYADSDDDNILTLNVTNFWSNFDAANPWRTTPSSQKRREPNDECFKYAAKASETIYWGEDPTTTTTEG